MKYLKTLLIVALSVCIFSGLTFGGLAYAQVTGVSVHGGLRAVAVFSPRVLTTASLNVSEFMDIVYEFLPLILTFMMLSMLFGMLAQFGGRMRGRN